MSYLKDTVSGFFKKHFTDFSLLGLIVLIMTILAMYFLGEKNKYAYIIFTISQLIQIKIFYCKRQGFLVLTMLFLIVLNILNYFKWS